MPFISTYPLAGIPNLSVADDVGPGPFNLTSGAVSLGREAFYFQKVPAIDSVLGGAEFIYAKNSAANVAGQSITSITTATGTSIATLTAGGAHGLAPGAVIILAGQTPSSYVGTWTVLSTPSTTTLTFNTGSVSAGPTTVQGTYTSGAIIPGALVSYSVTTANGAWTISAVPAPSTAGTGTPLSVAYTGLTANQWGWFQVSGLAVANTTGAPAAGGVVGIGTVGIVTPTLAAGKQVLGATYASAVSAVVGSGSSAFTLSPTQALVLLNNPTGQSQIL